jgi:hypothetical protein
MNIMLTVMYGPFGVSNKGDNTAGNTKPKPSTGAAQHIGSPKHTVCGSYWYIGYK